MKWSRTIFGRDWHEGLAHPAHGGTYRNGSAPVRRDRHQNWNSCCPASSLLEQSQHHVHHPTPQDTYICCAYSPRCFIIQKVKPTSGQNSSEPLDQDDLTTTNGNESIQDVQFDELLLSTTVNGEDSPINGDRTSETHSVFPVMEDTGIVASLPSEALNSTASSSTSAMPMSSAAAAVAASESQNFPPSPTLPHNQADVYSNHSPGHQESDGAGERTIPLPELKVMIRQQLEYYFSRENLASDVYLRSQMDGDQYVPISTIAQFNQIRRLTEDLNLVVEVLRESPYVQVDDVGEKVRPSQRSIVLILREIPESTPMKDLEELFSGENCPKFSRCEFAHNDTWYVLFDTDDDAKKAYCYLREDAKTFNGKPIMARIKASLTSAPYSHSYNKNGVSSPPTTESYTQQIPQQQQQPQPSQPQLPAQQQPHLQFAYASVSNETYNNQQICPPFYPPTMLQAWAPTTATCVDLGAVLSMNGLSPQAAYRPVNNTNKSNYATRERPVKPFNPPQNYNLSRNDQSNRYFGRSGHIPRQQQQAQQQQQPPFHNLINAANSFDYGPYASSLRNLHSFGLDLNTFATPNFCFRRLPSHTSYTSQSRHAPLLLPSRNQIGVGAINTQDQSYLPASSMMPFHKDTVTGASIASVSKQNTDVQNKDSWSLNQKQRNKKWSRENGNSGPTNKPFSETTNGYFNNKPVNGTDPKPESPKFNLQTASFPPLPGCLDTDVLEVDVYENTRLSDIVKGTAKPPTRDSKTQTSESALNANTLMKDSSTLTIEEASLPSDGAFLTAPASSLENCEQQTISKSRNRRKSRKSRRVGDPIASLDGSKEKPLKWIEETCESDISKEEPLLNSNSINSTTQTPSSNSAFNLASNFVASNVVPVSASVNSLESSPVGNSCTPAQLPAEQEISANVPSEVVAEKQTPPKTPKFKQPDMAAASSKSKSCDLPSPKSKTPESMGKMKTDTTTSKEKMPLAPKPPRANSFSINSTNKLPESSSTKDSKIDSPLSSGADGGVSRNSDAFSTKDKPLHPMKGRSSFDLSKPKGPEPTEPSSMMLTVNGHMDSESVSSEDEKQFRKLTYSEVAIRAKDRVEKIAQEIKEKERQEAMVRHHRQQEIVAQGKQGTLRGPFREFTRRVTDRSGTRDWRDRRKPARTVSLPSPGQ